jgi:hypothetical protein
VKGTAEAEFARISRLICEGRYEESDAKLAAMLGQPTFLDPEALFHSAIGLVRMGRHDRAMATLARAVERGFCALPALHRMAWLDPLRARPDFRSMVERAEDQRRGAMDAFILAGGERVVGVRVG